MSDDVRGSLTKFQACKFVEDRVGFCLMQDPDFYKLVTEMTRQVDTLVFDQDTVEESLKKIRKTNSSSDIIYFYAVDENKRLKGVVSTRQLILAHPDQKIEEIMQKHVIRIHAGASCKEALELFERHPLLALPVVDPEGQVIGTIDVQMLLKEPLNLADQQSRTDAFQMIGITLEEKRKIPHQLAFRNRMPWLLCNVFSGLMCALISRVFEVVLSKVLLLAFFIPLVLTLSESTSMQSMAQSLQFLRRPRLSYRSLKKKAVREWQLALMLATSLAVLVGLFSLLWQEGMTPSISIAIGIFLGIGSSTAFAIAIPIFLHRFQLDPKVASGPVVLMMADMLTTAIYLSIASLFL